MGRDTRASHFPWVYGDSLTPTFPSKTAASIVYVARSYAANVFCGVFGYFVFFVRYVPYFSFVFPYFSITFRKEAILCFSVVIIDDTISAPVDRSSSWSRLVYI